MNMFYEKNFIVSSDESQQISLEFIKIPFLYKKIISVVNRLRIVPFLDPNDLNQRNDIINIAKESLLTICFDMQVDYQEIIDSSGYGSELFKLYDGYLLTSLDQTISVKPNKRRDLKRRKNKLLEIGEVSCIVSKAQDFDNIKFNHFFNLLKISFDQKRVNTVWGMEQNKDLLRKVLGFQGSLIFELTLNKKTIAFAQCQIMSNNRLVYMIPSYDEEYAQFSPGMLLILSIMDYCALNNMILDLGKGNVSYKERFNTESYPVYIVFIFNNIIGKLILKPIKLLLNLFIFIKRRKNKHFKNFHQIKKK